MRGRAALYVFCYLFLALFCEAQDSQAMTKEDAGVIILNSANALTDFPLSELRQCADVMSAMQVFLEGQGSDDSVKSARLSRIFLAAGMNKIAMQDEDIEGNYESDLVETLSVLQASPDNLHFYLNSRSNACVQIFESKVGAIAAQSELDTKGVR